MKEDIKIESFPDYKTNETEKVNENIITPEKFKKIFEAKEKEEFEKFLTIFNNEVNERLPNATRETDASFSIYLPDSLDLATRKFKNKFDIIIEEYKKAGWFDVEIQISAFTIKLIFYIK